jgi:lipoprotein-anchoring transpeptidase ErfK/SrfK
VTPLPGASPYGTDPASAPSPSPYASPSTGVLGGPAAPPDTTTGSPAATPAAEKTLRVQVLLDRAHFSPGEIDGKDGDNTRRALASYNRERGAGTALEADATPHLVDYTIGAGDLAGPFTPEIPEDMMQKGKLPALNYTSALEALAERFHSSPALLRSLNPQATFSRAGERLRVPNVHTGPPPGKAARVVVDGSGPWVAAMDAQGRALAVYPATAGSQHDPLPLGNWKINGVSRQPTFNYNPDLFWDAEEGHAKARIPPGPNNPVGVVWIDLSKPHYGIHGTPEPSTIGKTQSHGCIRLTNWDVEELAGMVAPGTPVVIRK